MIYITLGDPFSINIECLAKLLNNPNYLHQLQEHNTTVLIGSYKAWLDQCSIQIPCIKNIKPIGTKGLYFYDLDQELTFEPKLTLKYRGELSRLSLAKLEMLTLDSKDAVLSCPLDKKLTFSKEKKPGGQTEFFEKLSKKQALMTLASPDFSVGLVTNHIPLSLVAQTITKELIQQKLALFSTFLQSKHPSPRIAVCSLNPHCGDGGLFGSEDQEIVAPALAYFLQNQKNNPCEIFGPLPADTLFWQAKKGKYHGILALYHDQGLAPIKALAFDKTVNISAGLNFLRVSPAHGPASDLFKRGLAEESSFEEALKIILDYTKSKV